MAEARKGGDELGVERYRLALDRVEAQRKGAQLGTLVRVSLPRNDNLQGMNFWVALGAGFFADEGLDMRLAFGGRGQYLIAGRVDVAVMPRPTFLTLVAEQEPVLAFANLLQNDPINFLVREAFAKERGLSLEMPLKERLEAVRGLKVGVAPGPPSRLRFLFRSVGLDADRDIEMVLVLGDGQNDAFAAGEVDALYSHTPYLEKALADQGAVMLVNQSGGQVPRLAGRQIHMMVTTRSYADANPAVAVAVARAVFRAQQLIHQGPEGTIEAIYASGAKLQAPQGLKEIVEIYQPAIPRSPEVSVAGAARELELFPARRRPLDMSGLDLADYVDNRFAREAVTDDPGH